MLVNAELAIFDPVHLGGKTLVHSPAVLGWRAKEVKVPHTCGPFARQITENSPQMPRYVPAGGGGGSHWLVHKRSRTCWINVHRKFPTNEMQHLHRLLLTKYTPLKILRHQIMVLCWIWKRARNIFPIQEPETDFGMAQGRFELWKQSKSDVQLLVSIAETALEV